MKITCFLHTAIVVSNLEKSEYFYSQILGLTKIKRNLKYPGCWYQIGNIQIHLIEDPHRKQAIINEDKLGRNAHFALSTTNLENTKTRLENHGYYVQMSASGRKALFTKDPDHNIIEISQIDN
jgi:catechol 2,3-dioxygenase-like lactoylglutathione lyase family enzyme